MPDMMTLNDAKKELAELEESTKKRANALRAYIRVLQSSIEEVEDDE